MAGEGTPALPWIVSSAISVFTLSLTGLGLWFSNRAQNKTSVIQDTAERVKAEQHLVELLQEENDRIRTAWAAEVQKAKNDCVEQMTQISSHIASRVTHLEEELVREKAAHDALRHRYNSDISALRGIISQEISKTAADLLGEDVTDVMKEAQPDPIQHIWPERNT